MELKSVPLESGKFPTDKDVERAYRAHPEYGEWRGREDDAQAAAEMAEAVYESFRLKVDLIKAQERILAHEAGGSSVSVENARATVPRQPKVGE